MAAMSVLSARYLFQRLRKTYPSLPTAAADIPRMHEFILTLSDDDFKKIEAVGVPRASAIGRVGKLFLDFGYHAPTVAFPEAFGLMIEPTESYTKSELDRFAESVEGIIGLIRQDARVLVAAPRFTPIDRVDDVTANRNLVLSEKLTKLPVVIPNRVSPTELNQLPVAEIRKRILATVV
jgi:glycine dehydrogenase